MTWGRASRYAAYSIALLCVPLALTTIILWVRSYFACDVWEYVTAKTDGSIEEIHRSAVSLLGRVEFETMRTTFTCATDKARLQFQGMVLSAVGFSHQASEPRPALIIDGRLPTVREQLSFDHSYEEFSAPIDPAEGVGRLHQHFSLSVPYWAPTLLFSAPPVWVAHRAFRRRHRAAAGRCRHCGYDLRGGHEICPECGTPCHVPADRSPNSPAAHLPQTKN